MPVEWKKYTGLIILIVLFIILTSISLVVAAIEVTTYTPCTTTTGSTGTTPVYLGDFVLGDNCYNILQIIFGNQIDKAWVETNSFLQYLIFPFIAIWLVMYGIFQEIIFFRRVTWFGSMMALVVALIVSSSGILVRMMRGYLMLAGGMGIIFFGFILFLGLIFWFIGRLGRFGASIPKVAQTWKDVGNIRVALQHHRGWAGSIERLDPHRAAQIHALAAQVEADLDKSPPDIPAANHKLNEIERLVNEYTRRTRT